MNVTLMKQHDKRARFKLLEDYDFNGKILEIGALHNPLFHKNDKEVYYLDIMSTEELKEHYKNEKQIVDTILPVDFILDDSYKNTFKDIDIEFDYVCSSHVLEHIPNPISYLLDISNILSPGGKVCMLIPDKEFTFDHYRENSSFADWFDVYTRGEKISTPRLVIDHLAEHVDENTPANFWNKKVNKYPAPYVEGCLEIYSKFVEDFENNYFNGHYWVFTDRSFLKILENLFKFNLIPFKLVDFYPTAYNDNTFGVILELDYTIKNNSKIRQNEIDKIRTIIKNIEKRRFEFEAREIIQYNVELKDKINEIIHILNR